MDRRKQHAQACLFRALLKQSRSRLELRHSPPSSSRALIPVFTRPRWRTPRRSRNSLRRSTMLCSIRIGRSSIHSMYAHHRWRLNTAQCSPCAFNALQREESMLTWEGSPLKGVNAIVEKLTVGLNSSGTRPRLTATKSLPFSKVVHQVSTVDAQPSSMTVPSMLVSVMGLLVVCSIISSHVMF